MKEKQVQSPVRSVSCTGSHHGHMNACQFQGKRTRWEHTDGDRVSQETTNQTLISKLSSYLIPGSDPSRVRAKEHTVSFCSYLLNFFPVLVLPLSSFDADEHICSKWTGQYCNMCKQMQIREAVTTSSGLKHGTLRLNLPAAFQDPATGIPRRAYNENKQTPHTQAGFHLSHWLSYAHTPCELPSNPTPYAVSLIHYQLKH